MIQKRTTYELWGESVNLEGETVSFRMLGYTSPSVQRSSQVDDWRTDLTHKNGGRLVRITLWYPIKSEWVWKDWVKNIFKKKQKTNA